MENLDLTLPIETRWTTIETPESVAANLHVLTQKVAKIGGETRQLLQRISELEAVLGQSTPAVKAALGEVVSQAATVHSLVN